MSRIGEIFVECGSSYLYSLSSFANFFKTKYRNIGYKWSLVKNNLTKNNNYKMALTVKTIIVEDVENTIKKSINKIFMDHTISNRNKERYAKGLIFIGNIFKKIKFNKKDAINIIKGIL